MRESERATHISGTAQPRAQEHLCRAGAVCSAGLVCSAGHDLFKCILLSHASYACDHPHTPTHTHTLQTIETTGQLPTPPACSTPPGTIERFFAGAAEQHGKTAAPPANARPSPRVAGRTQPSIHANGGERSPPTHGRTDVSPSHALHSSPLDTPASTRARRLDDGRRPPPHHAQRLRPTRTPHVQQQRAPRRPPTETLQCRASTRPRPHPARADTAPTPTHATRDRPTRARARRRSSGGGVRPPGTAQPRAQEHGTPCSVAGVMSVGIGSSSHAPLLLATLLSHNIPLPRVH